MQLTEMKAPVDHKHLMLFLRTVTQQLIDQLWLQSRVFRRWNWPNTICKRPVECSSTTLRNSSCWKFYFIMNCKTESVNIKWKGEKLLNLGRETFLERYTLDLFSLERNLNHDRVERSSTRPWKLFGKLLASESPISPSATHVSQKQQPQC